MDVALLQRLIRTEIEYCFQSQLLPRFQGIEAKLERIDKRQVEEERRQPAQLDPNFEPAKTLGLSFPLTLRKEVFLLDEKIENVKTRKDLVCTYET